MQKKSMLLIIALLLVNAVLGQVRKWEKYEIHFTSDKSYENPIYDVENFSIQLQSPSGRQINLNGFWALSPIPLEHTI